RLRELRGPLPGRLMAAAPPLWRSPDLPIRVGISSCLLGGEVRYDGGDQKDPYITSVLARHFTWVPVCPELEVGMGVPREPIRLVGDPAAPRLLGVTSGADHTTRMNEFARRRAQELGRRGLPATCSSAPRPPAAWSASSSIPTT